MESKLVPLGTNDIKDSRLSIVDPKSDFRQEAVSAKTKKKKGKHKERQIFLFCGAARSIFWRNMDNMTSELHVASGFLKKY